MRLDVKHGDGESRTTRNFLVASLPKIQKISKSAVQPAEMIAVLDCSGSMSGVRIRLATGILENLLQNPLIAKMQVVKFGSSVQEPLHFEKNEIGKISKIGADLGGTNFDLPMKKLISILESPSNHRRVAMFFSDGEASNPNDLYQPLQHALEKNDCPLLSVAVTTAAQPELMIRLSELYGETDLVLLRQDDSVENGLALVEDKMSLGNSLMEGTLQVITNSEKSPIKIPFRCREGQEQTFLIYDSPKGSNPKLDKISIHLEGTTADLEIKSPNDISSGEKRLEAVNEILTHLSKDFISKFVSKKIDQNIALDMIKQLRSIVKFCSIDENFFSDIENLYVNSPHQKTRAEILKKQKDLRKYTHQLSHQLNVLESVIGGGDLRAALEAYSAKTVSHKFNRRAMQIAQRNLENQKSDELPIDLVRAIEKSCPTQKNQETPECLLWCINHIQVALENINPKDQGMNCLDLDWVGRGCLVVPGKTAALNPWAVKSIIPRPVNISNQSIGFIKIQTQNNGRRLAEVKGLSIGEFNCSIPFVHPNENLVLARLSLSLLRSTNFGTSSFSDLFCGSPNLFIPDQIFSLYTACAISAFDKATNSVHFEDSIRAVMTLWDLSYFSPFTKEIEIENYKVLHGVSKGFKFVTDNLDRLIADPDLFISSKEDSNTPHIHRVIYLLTVGMPYLQGVMGTQEKLETFLNSIFHRLTLRHILDSTSGRFQLKQIAGFDQDPYMKKIMENIQEGNLNKDPIEANFAPNGKDVFPKLGLFRLFVAKAFLQALIDFKTSTSCKTFRELHLALLKKEICLSKFVNSIKSSQCAFKSAKKSDLLFSLLNTSEEKVLSAKRELSAGINITSSPSPHDLLTNILIAALKSHLEDSEIQPKHDSSFNSTFFKNYPSWECFFKQSVYFALAGLKNRMQAKVQSELGELSRRLMITKRLIKRVETHRKVCKIERLCHPFKEDALSFTGPDVPTFKTRRGMFQFLKYGGYTDEILKEIREFGIHNINNLNVQELLNKGSQYVHGFSLFSKNRLAPSGSYVDFEKSMLNDLKSHCKKKNTEGSVPYLFNEPRIKEIKKMCFQVYHDTQIYKFLRNQVSGDPQVIYKAALAKFPDCLTWNGYDKAIREEHLKELCEATVTKSYPIF